MAKKIFMYCPMCGEEHDVELLTEKSEVIIKEEIVKYNKKIYHCVNCEEDEAYFTTAALSDENLLNARDAYRKAKGLLTSSQIKSARIKYSLSQAELSKIMGWGEVTVTRYETKQIQDKAHDDLLRIIRDDPAKLLEIFERNKDAFDLHQGELIRSRIINELNTDSSAVLKRENLRHFYAQYGSPSIENGYTLLNIDKIEQIVNFFAERFDNLYKVLLMKLLWYSDALNFKLNGRAMTGLVYVHEKFGALPVGHYQLVELSGINYEEVEIDSYGNTGYEFHPNEKTGCDAISEDEKKVLEMVCEKFGDFDGSKIKNYMHDEAAYQKTAPKDIITFAYAGEIRDF